MKKTGHFIDLKDLGSDKVSLEVSLQPGEIDFTGDPIQQIGPLVCSGEVGRAGEEIRIAGSLQGVIEANCSRCLEPARNDVSRTFDLYFRERDKQMFDEDEEVELDEEDTSTAFFTGTQLAIGDVLREQVLLALPMKILCTPDCKGLCPTCGTNLNLSTCNCPKEQFSPHMDKLLEIKRKLEERSS
jgi:DUF177 domain-containing protein